MKKKLFVIMLILALCLRVTPTFAAKAISEFVDVSSDAWYAPYVDYVSQSGVMIGTGDGAFSPEKALTQAECLTLTYRLYDLLRGQENVVEAAPKEWGYIALTVEGRTFEGYGDDKSGLWYWGNYSRTGAGYLMMNLLTPELEKWGQTQQGVRAVVTAGGNTYEGYVDSSIPLGNYIFTFHPNADVAEEASADLWRAVYRQPGPDHWWRDICYTLEKRELTELFAPADFQDNNASRAFFAKALYAAAGKYLEKINEVAAIPDLSRTNGGNFVAADLYREQVYALYEAGILNGMDEAGTFAADKSLTRAEAATMVARVLEPSLRIGSNTNTNQ